MTSRPTVILHTLKEFAAKELDQAMEKLAQANKTVDEAKAKLEMLNQYREDYINRLTEMLGDSLEAGAYQNYQNFLRKLDQAIRGQDDVLNAVIHQAELQRDAWQECQKKKMSYDILLERSQKKAHHAEMQKEQKMTDEFASRKAHQY